MLSDLGYDISVVSVLSGVDYHFSGNHLDLGEMKNDDASFFGKTKRMSAFKNFIDENKFDFIIDCRPKNVSLREVFIYRHIYKNRKVINVVHSHHLQTYFISPKWLSKVLFKNCFRIVGVSQAISAKIETVYGFKNVTTIYNSVKLNTSKNSEIPLDFPYLLYFGRIEDSIKNLSLLLASYKQSSLNEKGFHLVLLGDGPDKEKLKNFTKQLKLQNFIHFLDFTLNPEPIVSRAKCTVLTSHYEGLPMVLIESLSLGTPVISVEYNSGVKEIVKNGHNGLIVPNYSSNELANAFNRFFEDEALYLRCKENAKSSVAKFEMYNVSKQWNSLLQNS
ncbi:Glycosyltransferase involved in cell wall bisynthesis [Flavobacteriaceae bacterium MAR_2010_188]|nr:Glycosyltransferase involved in cell wall bisynthesis [Flavobacteriaceae bacterium MAR_2010_188]